MSNSAGPRLWPWLVAGFGVAYFANLGMIELSPIDECRSAVVARDMSDGNWLLPRTPDGYLSEKPPIYYALTAVATRAFGESEESMRGVSVIFAIGTLVIVGWVAGLLGSPIASTIAVVALGSNLIFLATARIAMVDMTFTFFVTAGLAAYLAGRLGKFDLWSTAAWCGIAFGMAVLSKGPLGLAFPATAIAIDCLFATKGRFWKSSPAWLAGAAACVITLEISLIWYLPGALAGGSEFLHTSLLDENFYMPLGLSQGIAGSHTKPLWYYPTRQLAAILPAAALVPEAIRQALRRDRGPATPILAAWIAGGFLVLFAASNKRLHYLLPLQPAVALLVALALAPLASLPPTRLFRNSTRAMGIALGIAAAGLAACTVLRVGPSHSPDANRLTDLIWNHRSGIALASCALIWAGLLMFAGRQDRTSDLLRAVAVAAVLAVPFRTIVHDPVVASENRMRPFVAKFGTVAGAEVAAWPPAYGYGLDFYWPTRLARGPVAAQRARYLFVRENLIPTLPFETETLGVIEFSSENRRTALVRKR